MRFLSVVAVAVLCMCSAACQSAQENECLFKGDDPRLEKPIDFTANGLRLADAFAALGQQAGVTMIAGSDADDWMVYDRKVIVHVTNMPLRDLMSELSKTLSFHWTRTGNPGEWTYRFMRSEADEANELALRTARTDQTAKLARQKRESALSDLVNLTSLAPGDIQRLKDTDPWRYILATETLGKDVALFLKSHPESREAFLSGVGSSTPVSVMPAEMQEAVRRIAASYDALTKSIGASEDHADLLSNFDKLQVTINRRSLSGTDVFTQSMLGSITIGYGVGPDSIEVPVFDPTSQVAKAFGRAVLSLRSGANKEEVAKQLAGALKTAASDAGARGSARDISSDPDLRKPIELFKKPVSAQLTTTLSVLAAVTKMNIISDYFHVEQSKMPAGEKSLGEQLELIRTAYGSNWEKAGNTLRFRDSEWYIKRTWEVPQVWLDFWVSQGERSHGLELTELAEIARLRDEQLDHIIAADPDLVRLGAGEAVRNREIMRFYQSLTKEQVTQLNSQSLPVSSLSEEQWQKLKTALATKGAAYGAVEKASQTMTLQKKVIDSSPDTPIAEYALTYRPESGEPVTFKITVGEPYKTGSELGLPPGADTGMPVK
jgi:hypothetical protein